MHVHITCTCTLCMETIYRALLLKIARPDSSQNFMDTVKIIDLTSLCMQINNTAVFSNQKHIKLIKKSATKYVNSKPLKYTRFME